MTTDPALAPRAVELMLEFPGLYSDTALLMAEAEARCAPASAHLLAFKGLLLSPLLFALPFVVARALGLW